MTKKERAKNDEVYMCGFVPCHLLPNRRPNALDPFIHPLIEEVKDLFINGNFNNIDFFNISYIFTFTITRYRCGLLSRNCRKSTWKCFDKMSDYTVDR